MSGLPEHSMSDMHLDVIGFDEAETFPGLFQQRVARTPDTIAYRQYDAGGGVWKAYNWKQMAGLVACWQAALAKEGLAAGDHLLPVFPSLRHAPLAWKVSCPRRVSSARWCNHGRNVRSSVCDMGNGKSESRMANRHTINLTSTVYQPT